MKIILLISILFLFCHCKPQNYTYEISGSLPSNIYDGELIYLVPFKNASPETVDSTRIKDGGEGGGIGGRERNGESKKAGERKKERERKELEANLCSAPGCLPSNLSPSHHTL